MTGPPQYHRKKKNQLPPLPPKVRGGLVASVSFEATVDTVSFTSASPRTAKCDIVGVDLLLVPFRDESRQRRIGGKYALENFPRKILTHTTNTLRLVSGVVVGCSRCQCHCSCSNRVRCASCLVSLVTAAFAVVSFTVPSSGCLKPTAFLLDNSYVTDCLLGGRVLCISCGTQTEASARHGCATAAMPAAVGAAQSCRDLPKTPQGQ